MRRCAVLAAVLFLAACSAEQPPPPPAPASAPVTSAAESPVLRLERAVPTAAAMTKAGYNHLGKYRPFVVAENQTQGLLRSCAPSTSDQRIDHSGIADWYSVEGSGHEGVALEMTVTHYRDGQAAMAVAGARQQLACGRFRDRAAAFTVTVTEQVTLPELTTVDSQHAVCGMSEYDFLGCVLLLAKGDVGGALVITGPPGKVAGELRRVAPIFAEPLGKA